VVESITRVLIDHGLRRVEATTDTHTITVEEPYMWSEEFVKGELQTKVHEHDI
jgi:hypothetical protein